MPLPKFDYKLFASEAAGTALLLFGGLNIVIFNWGEEFQKIEMKVMKLQILWKMDVFLDDSSSKDNL